MVRRPRRSGARSRCMVGRRRIDAATCWFPLALALLFRWTLLHGDGWSRRWCRIDEARTVALTVAIVRATIDQRQQVGADLLHRNPEQFGGSTRVATSGRKGAEHELATRVGHRRANLNRDG